MCIRDGCDTPKPLTKQYFRQRANGSGRRYWDTVCNDCRNVERNRYPRYWSAERRKARERALRALAERHPEEFADLFTEHYARVLRAKLREDAKKKLLEGP